jgi:phosphatidylethanolamine N-methyltransferase
MTAYDSTLYNLTLPSSSSRADNRFCVGQPIQVSWSAPSNHSRKDWIGIYRLGSCKSQIVTRVSSMGKWKPLYAEEWDGDEPLQVATPSQKEDAGTVVFRGDALPWAPGQYELRLHHDGKHNVMTRLAPLEIFGESVWCSPVAPRRS